MLFDSEAHRDAYIIFHDDTDYPLSQFFKKGFKHVFVIERQALGWVCIDPSRSDLCSLILPAPWKNDIIPEFLRNNPRSTVIHVSIKPQKRLNYPRAGVISCVSTVQYYLGVWWPYILTPYRLYNKIINRAPKHIKVNGLWQAARQQDDRQKQQQRRQTLHVLRPKDKDNC